MSERSVTCPCGAVFRATGVRAKYCSDGCRTEGARKSWRDYGTRNQAARRAYHADRYDKDPAATIARTQAYHQTEAGKAARRVADENQRAKDHEKRQARAAFNAAIASGVLVRQPCEVCGDGPAHGHHEDYSKPLIVKWLCPKHHGARHREIRRQAQKESA